MVVFYLPLVALSCALLLPMVKNGAHVGIFVFGVVLLMEYMIVIPSLGYKLIVLARRRFEWLAEQRYVEHHALLTDGLHMSHSAFTDSFTPFEQISQGWCSQSQDQQTWIAGKQCNRKCAAPN